MEKFLFILIAATIIISCNNDQQVTYDSDSWFINNQVTAHAGGGIIVNDSEYVYTNSKEAFENSYSQGIRVFETDICLTREGNPVLVHSPGQFAEFCNISIDKVLGDSTFCKSKICGKFTPMTFNDLLDFMTKYPDTYIDLDMKCRVDGIKSVLKAINNKFNDEDATKILDRLIIEFYDENDYKKIDSLYHFKNYMYSLYTLPIPINKKWKLTALIEFTFECIKNGNFSKINKDNYIKYYNNYLDEIECNKDFNKEIIEFCLNHDIAVVGNHCRRFNKEICDMYKKHGIKTIAYNELADRYPDCLKLKEEGVYGIQSDFVTPDQWK